MKEAVKLQLSTENWKPRAMRAGIAVTSYLVGLSHFPGHLKGGWDLDKGWLEVVGLVGIILASLLTGNGKKRRRL